MYSTVALYIPRKKYDIVSGSIIEINCFLNIENTIISHNNRYTTYCIGSVITLKKNSPNPILLTFLILFSQTKRNPVFGKYQLDIF